MDNWRDVVKVILGIAAVIGIPIFLIVAIDFYQLIGFTLGIIWAGIALTLGRIGKGED